jgi:TPR repeat protein
MPAKDVTAKDKTARRCGSIASSVLAAVSLLALQPGIVAAGPLEDGDIAFRNKQYTAAMAHWKPVATAGNARAQLGVARLFYNGLGTTVDYGQAFVWCRRASDQGLPEAQNMLGAMYRDGAGTRADHGKAFSLFQTAAEKGVVGAQYNIGLMYFSGRSGKADYREAFYWLSLAAEAPGKENDQLRPTASHVRDQAAEKLSPGQIEEAKQRLATTKSTTQAR